MRAKLGRDPLEILIRAHEEGMDQLGVLENAAESIRAGGFSPEAFEQIAETIRWMNTEVRRHTQLEEEVLFPLVERHVKGLAEQMRGEHRDLWNAFSELLTYVREVEEGRLHGSSIRDVVSVALEIVDQMRSHIKRENTILFPAVRQLFTETEYDDLLSEIVRRS